MKNKIHHLVKAFHPARVSSLANLLLKDEAIGGKLIVLAVAASLIAANSFLADAYKSFWSTDLSLGIGDWSLKLDLRHWLSDGLMTLFFLTVGLEIKRELSVGELKDHKVAALPIAAAFGGMAVPAIIYSLLNIGGEGSRGWAIPMATDIALAIGVLSLLGNRISSSLRIFLLTLAIVDDIAAIMVIAVFYSAGVDVWLLAAAVGVLFVTYVLGRLKLMRVWLFTAIGLSLWLIVNESGIHPAVVGSFLGLVAPVGLGSKYRKSITESVEKAVIPLSALVIVPLFAFANAGVVISSISFEDNSLAPISLGVFFGLALGKVLGITGAVWLMVKLGFARLPRQSGWSQIIGIGFLAGIGFTVAIFISELAFKDEGFVQASKVSIFASSLASSILGYLILIRSTTKKDNVALLVKNRHNVSNNQN